MPGESPWQGRDMDAEHARSHDPAACRICRPLQSDAFHRGVARAAAHSGLLPMTSSEREVGSGRDVYEQPDDEPAPQQ